MFAKVRFFRVRLQNEYKVERKPLKKSENSVREYHNLQIETGAYEYSGRNIMNYNKKVTYCLTTKL